MYGPATSADTEVNSGEGDSLEGEIFPMSCSHLFASRRVPRMHSWQILSRGSAKNVPCEQLIGKISPHQLFPSPPFSSVTADVAGPYIVQDRTSSTKISKVWALVYLCDNSKALHTEVVEDYSRAALITALRQAFAIRNMPAQITTDPGRNFIKAKSLFSSDYADAKLKNSIAEEICAASHKSSRRFYDQNLHREVAELRPW